MDWSVYDEIRELARLHVLKGVPIQARLDDIRHALVERDVRALYDRENYDNEDAAADALHQLSELSDEEIRRQIPQVDYRRIELSELGVCEHKDTADAAMVHSVRQGMHGPEEILDRIARRSQRG